MQQYRLKLRFLFVVLVILTLAIFGMLGAFSTMEAAAKPRATPTPTCETIAEGILRCGAAFATSVARPNEKNRPVRATATPKPKGATK